MLLKTLLSPITWRYLADHTATIIEHFLELMIEWFYAAAEVSRGGDDK